MPNRFSGQYNIDYAPHHNPMAEAQARKRRQWAQMMQMGAGIAGGIGGAALGASVGDPLGGLGAGVKAGTAIGGFGASAMNNSADELEDPERLREQKRQAIMMALSRGGF